MINWSWLEKYLTPFDEPGSRLFHWNLVVAVLLVVVWFILLQKTQKLSVSVIKKVFFRKLYWWNRSTRKDYFYYFLNGFLKAVFFIPFLDMSFFLAKLVSQGLLSLNQNEFLNLPQTQIAIAVFSIGSFVWDDLLRFVQHWFMHHTFLWRFHAIHHSAKVMTPVSLFRNHPIESALATLRNSASVGVSAGLFVFIFGAQLSVWTIAGVNVFGFLFNILGANLRHSHVPLRFPAWMERILISPYQHQIHHSSSPEHFDKNLGVSLALWDWVLGSLVKSADATKKFSFGVGSYQQRSIRKDLLGF